VVRQIFDWAAQGVNHIEIARRLNDTHITPPSLYKYKKGTVKSDTQKGCGYWIDGTITELLRDKVYQGDMVQGKSRTYNHKRKEISPDEWVTVENTHEPIVSRELFAAVSRIREQAAKNPKNPAIPHTPNILKGKIFCGRCGFAMHRRRSTAGYWYNCESRNRYSKAACVQVSIKESDVLEAVLVMLHEHYNVIIGKGMSLWYRRHEMIERQTARNKELTKIRQELSQNSGYSRSLYESRSSGLITWDEYRQMKADYERKNNELRTRAAALEQEQRDFELQNDTDFDMFERLRDTRYKTDISRELIELLVDKITISPNKHIDVKLKFCDEFTEYMEVQKCVNM
jgi:hypothetical protein